MRISELYSRGKPVFSFEFFPPKTDDGYQGLYAAIAELMLGCRVGNMLPGPFVRKQSHWSGTVEVVAPDRSCFTVDVQSRAVGNEEPPAVMLFLRPIEDHVVVALAGEVDHHVGLRHHDGGHHARGIAQIRVEPRVERKPARLGAARALHSRPESGEVFTPNVMLSVGASTSRRARGRGSAGSVSVSPIVTSGSPATDTMSPGPASAMSIRSMPWAVWSAVTVPLSVTIRPGSTVPPPESLQ